MKMDMFLLHRTFMPFPTIRLLVLLCLSSFSLSQDSNGTSSFILSTAASMLLCRPSSLNWSGETAVPPYGIYMTRGSGPIENESILDPETFVDFVNSTKIRIEVDESWAGLGNIIRFRIQEHGKGGNAIAWSLVTDNRCEQGENAFAPVGNVITVTGNRPDGVTSKNTDIMTVLATISAQEATAAPTPILPEISHRPIASSLRPSQVPSVPSPTISVFNQENRGSPSEISGTNSRTNEPTPALPSDSHQSTMSIEGGRATMDELSSLGGGYESHSLRRLVPDESSGQSDTAPTSISLSVQAIATIVTTTFIAVLLWVVFMIWRSRQQKRPVPLRRQNKSAEGSTQALMTFASEPPGHVRRLSIETVATTNRNQICTLKSGATHVHGADQHKGAVVPSYDEATGLSSLFNIPNPLHRPFDTSRNFS